MIKIKKAILLLILIFSNSLYAQIAFHSAEEAAEYALINSPNFNYQRLNAELGIKMAKNSIEGFLPTFNISWADNKSLNYQAPDSGNKSFSVSMNQFVFDGGKKALSYQMQKTSSMFSYQSYLQSEKTFRSQIIAQYYECITQQKIIEIKKQLESLATENLLILKTEYELGRALENDYLEYLISYKQIQNERMQFERDYRMLLRSFKIALNLSPEVEITLEDDSEPVIEAGFMLEDYITFLWNRYQAISVDVQQLNLNLAFAKKQLELSRRQYVPEVSLTADLSFSGDAYPMSAPSYNIKLNVGFNGFPVLPVNVGSGIGLNSQGKLSNARNDSSVTVSPQLNYVNSLKAGRISLNQKEQERKDTINSYYESLFKLISQYDDSTNSILLNEETMKLQERRMQISQEMMNAGMLSRIKYLEQLTEYTNQQIQLETAKNNYALSERSLEIMLDIPFGGLHDVCKENK